LRLLAQGSLRYRRQILALKQFFVGRRCTVLLLDDRTPETGVHSLVNGVLTIEQLAPIYGAERRRLRVGKLRGVAFRGGYHDLIIRTGGLVVFPRLVAADHKGGTVPRVLSSGIAALDRLLGGGLASGTSTLIVGPAGSGKSTIAMQFALAAARRGENVAHFAFDETIATFFTRAGSLGLDEIQALAAQDRYHLQQVDPAELAPGQFAQLVRHVVEERDVRLVVIDSLNGYLNAMPEEQYLTIQMHEMLTYLSHRGVATVLLVAQHGVLGSAMTTPIDVSYLADTVVLLRYFEAHGAVRQALSVVKKRSGEHERTIREFGLGNGGVRIGDPLVEFHGILTGVPTYDGSKAALLRDPPA